MSDPTLTIRVANRDPMELHENIRVMLVFLKSEMHALGHPIFLVEGYRSDARQEWLYQQGRSRPGRIVTYARAGTGWHATRRAVDLAFLPLSKGQDPWDDAHPWSALGAAGKKLGLVWGGDWASRPDRPHFEDSIGISHEAAIREAKAATKTA